MPNLTWWKRALMATGLCLAAVAGVTFRAQPARSGTLAEAAEVVAQAEGDKHLYLGAGSCMQCHKNEKEGVYPTNPRLNGYIKFNEYVTWSTVDKHKIAYTRLRSPRGLAMASRLGVADATDAKVGCLGCHSAGRPEIADRNQGDQFERSDGVSCENCHGPSSDWTGPHSQVKFREDDTAKRTGLGMIDLRVPEIEASQCLSCHIGNSAEGKVVTHDMYAAGHPPLPSIEVSTFIDSIPRHWFLEAEKPEKIREKAYEKGQLERTKLTFVGAAIALKTTMKLLAEEARTQGEKTEPGLGWPDYARFDCWACHHDLKRDSWRQARGFQGAPGRVPIAEWPTTVAELSIAYLTTLDKSSGVLRADLDRLQKAVHDQANARPFGKKVQLADAADEFANWADVLAKKLAQTSFDQDSAVKILSLLVTQAQKSTPDFDAARHVGWTIQVLVADAGPKLEKRTEVEAVLAKIVEGLNLTLPAGQKYEIEDELPSALKTIGDYEPAKFREHLEELAKLLPKP